MPLPLLRSGLLRNVLCGGTVIGTPLKYHRKRYDLHLCWCLFTWSLSKRHKSFTRICWRHVRTVRQWAWSHYGTHNSYGVAFCQPMFCALVILIACPPPYFVVHCPCAVFTNTQSPVLKTVSCWLCVSTDVPWIRFSRMQNRKNILAVAEDTSLFSGTYQYTASGIIHCFLVAILFTVLWHCLMMQLPEGMYTQQNQSLTFHSSKEVLNKPLQKAVSLSVRISIGRSWS